MVTGIVNIVFALITLIEAGYLSWKIYCKKSLGTTDREFCSYYLLGLGNSGSIDIIIDNYKKDLVKNKFKMDIHDSTKGTLDDQYVPPSILDGRDEVHGAGTKRHNIYKTYLNIPNGTLIHDIKDLFKNTGQRTCKILLIGRPGIGKSVLSKKIVLEWKNTKSGAFHNQRIAVLLDFASLNLEKKNLTLKEMLEKSRGISALKHDEFDSLFEYILENPKEVLLIFDGLDELKVDPNCVLEAESAPDNHWTCMSIFSLWYKLISGWILNGATVITTSRPTGHRLYSKLEKDIDKTLEILGFTESKIAKYVQNFCSNRNMENEKLWGHIKESAELHSLCYIPANSSFVCKENKAHLQRTLTEFYKRVIRMLLWNHHPACKYEIRTPGHLDSDLHNPLIFNGVLEKLKTLAKDGMENNLLKFNLEITSPIENCGMFNSLTNEYESQFWFLHLTLQEYFAAWKFADGCKQCSDVEKVLSKYLQHPARWDLVIQFFAGLLGDKVKKGELSKDCYKCFSAHIPSDVTNWQGPRTREVLQMIKCLYELRDEEIIASTACNVVCGEEHEMTFQGTDCCRIYPADCKAFSHFLSHIKNLHRLDLSSHRIGDSGCLELLSTCNELAEVNLNGNEITDQGVKDLSEALKNKEFKLTSLKLGNNKITDVGVKNLIEALENGNCKLTSIDLDGNMITDESAKHLHEALTNKNC